MIYKTVRLEHGSEREQAEFFKHFIEYNNEGSKTISLSNSFFVTIANVDLMTTWKENRQYTLPAMPKPVKAVKYLITPHTPEGYRRVFALFTYDDNKAIACEIPLVAIVVAPYGVCDILGNDFNADLSEEVYTLDNQEIRIVLVDRVNKNYIALQSKDNRLVFEIGSSLLASVNINTHENLLSNVGLI